MKVSLSWLKEYIPIDIKDGQVGQIADKLTMAGLEVVAIENLYTYLDKIIVAKIVETRKHPNAEKLTCCIVDIGSVEGPVQIVCGAPNVKKDMIVACALPEALLPENFKIKKSKLKGEISNGMLCSAKELRLDADDSGIMDLEVNSPPGTLLRDAMGIFDVCFEIDLTPNRSDCLSVLGIAREICAFLHPKNQVSTPVLPKVELSEKLIESKSIHDLAKVRIDDPLLCSRYTAGMISNIKVGHSPFWLQQRLESIGLTPINNIVDITNFVMMETGQPLHAFDYDLLVNSEIVVKQAGSCMEFTTLDSKTHMLKPEMLMICDGKGPVAIAGIMGGENSEIKDSTTRVLLESACFDPVSIRKTVKKTGISTDASHRFERGVDSSGTLYALKRALSLLADTCGGTVVQGIIDEYPNIPVPISIELDTNWLNVRLGTNLSYNTILQLLESIQFNVEMVGKDRMKVTVPSFRVDVNRPEDLCEEVARLWGYNSIETNYPMMPAKNHTLPSLFMLRRTIRQIMSGISFCEVINYSFINSNSCDLLMISELDERRNMVPILNPISENMSVLRTSLIPGLLETMQRNNAQHTDTVRIFETGKIFVATEKDKQPKEVEMIAGLISGNRYEKSWYTSKESFDFFDMKGAVESLFKSLSILDVEFVRTEGNQFPYLEKNFSALVKKEDDIVGVVGKISPTVLSNFKLKREAFIFDFDLNILMSIQTKDIQASSLPKFPATSRDLTLIVGHQVEAEAILKEIKNKDSLIEDASLFDLFDGKSIAHGKKALSFRIVYRSAEKTLTEKNVNKLHTKISQAILKKFDGELPE